MTVQFGETFCGTLYPMEVIDWIQHNCAKKGVTTGQLEHLVTIYKKESLRVGKQNLSMNS